MPDRWSVLHLQQNDLRLTLLPGIGGRLWDVEYRGRSLLFQNPDLEGLAVDDTRLDGLPTRSPQFGFPLWGGEKTWIAPDTAWSNGAPFPVLDSAVYEVISQDNTHVEMASDICPVSELSVTRRVALISANSWTIEHSVRNHGDTTRPTGLWSVMMIDTPAKVGVSTENPSVHPVFGSANGMVAVHGNCVVADCTRQQEFKIGLPNPHGRTLMCCGDGGPWLKCSVPEPQKGDRFAHGCPFEIFNSGDYAYCEAEWHSPLGNLGPKETLQYQQTFDICDQKDAALILTSDRELVSCMS